MAALSGLLLFFLILAFFMSRKPSSAGKQDKRKGKRKKKKKKNKDKGPSLEIDPSQIIDEFKNLAPSEQKSMKAEHIGRLVEIPTVVAEVLKSELGEPYRRLLLQYRDKRTIQILGDLNTADYEDKSWMTREGQILIRGTIRDFSTKEFLMEDLEVI